MEGHLEETLAVSNLDASRSCEWVRRVISLLDDAVRQLHPSEEVAQGTVLEAASLLRKQIAPAHAGTWSVVTGCAGVWAQAHSLVRALHLTCLRARSPGRVKESSDAAECGYRRLRVSDSGRYSQFNFCARVPFAPDVEPTANAFAALAHPRQSPVACALTTGEDRRVDTDPIIPYAYAQIRFPKGDFGLNMSGVRMVVRVADRLACDAIDVVTNHGSQLARPALDDYVVPGL